MSIFPGSFFSLSLYLSRDIRRYPRFDLALTILRIGLQDFYEYVLFLLNFSLIFALPISLYMVVDRGVFLAAEISVVLFPQDRDTLWFRYCSRL